MLKLCLVTQRRMRKTSLIDDWEDYRKTTFTIFFLMTALPAVILYHSDLIAIFEDIGISFGIGSAMAYVDYLWEIGLTIFVFLILLISFLAVFTLIGVFLNFTNSFVIMDIAVICSILGITLSKHRQITILYRRNYNSYNKQPQDKFNDEVEGDEDEEEAYRKAAEEREKARRAHIKEFEEWEEAEYLKELQRSQRKNREFYVIPNSIGSVEEAYILFGLSQTATNNEIKNAYRKFTKLYHPDKNFKNTNREMQIINEAYDLIRQSRKA